MRDVNHWSALMQPGRMQLSSTPDQASRTSVVELGDLLLHRTPKHRGQAFVELALILPVFLLIVMGVLDLGRVFYTYEAIANAAREGARYCALNAHVANGNPSTGTTSRVTGELSGTGISATVASPVCDTTVVAGNQVTVTVNTTYTPVTSVVTGPITLSAHASMVMWQ